MLKILVINQHTANFGDDAAGVASRGDKKVEK